MVYIIYNSVQLTVQVKVYSEYTTWCGVCDIARGLALGYNILLYTLV